MHIFLFSLIWLVIGFIVVRQCRGHGDWIAMIHYNFPWLGLLFLVLSWVLWPLVLLNPGSRR